VSAGALLIAIAGLLYLGLVPAWGALALALGGYVLIEAAFQRRLVEMILRVTVLLATLGAIVLALTHASLLIVAAVIVVALVTIADNLRELRS
jgi:hypothetical protein